MGAESHALGHALKRGTLLVASRDDRLSATVRGLNGSLEMEVDVVAQGRDLISKIAVPGLLPHEGDGGSIRLLLLDDDLVDGRGRTLLRYIHSVRPDLKVIFTAGGGAQSVEVEVRREGVYFFLPKPVSMEILRKVVAKAIEHESTRNRWKVG